jgi:hypothetical protein
LLPLSENVVAPGEFPAQTKTEIFDVIRCGKLNVVHVYQRALACARGECNVGRLAGVGLHAPLEEPGMKGVKVLLEVNGSCSGVMIGGKNGCVVGKGC